MSYEDQLSRQLSQDIPSELTALTHRVIGCAIEVHRVLGAGYLESTYQLALEAELEGAGLGFAKQVPVSLHYKGRRVGEFRLDLVVEETLVVELKAVESLSAVHTAQVISYVKAAGLPVGLLINFNVPVLVQGVRRILHPR